MACRPAIDYTRRVTGSGPEVLYSRASAGQRVLLEREADGSLSLTINGHWQFSSRDEAIFHELLVDLPMVLAPSVQRVLVLGGGDALALRNLLRYEALGEVHLCELDAGVLEMVRTVPELTALSEGALDDRRVTVRIADALDFVRQAPPRPFDVIICDFPACTDAALQPLFSREFYERVAQWLTPEGLVSIQVSQDPAGFWSFVESALEPTFDHLWPSLVPLGDPRSEATEWADFVIASRAALAGPRRAFPDGATQVLRADALSDQRIVNRSAHHFETAAYGRAPDFSETW